MFAEGLTWSERKSYEDRLKKMNAALEASKAYKDKLYSMLAHDLRTPFNAICGLSSLLLEDAMSMSREEIKEQAKLVNDACERHMELLDDLLQWSATQSGFETKKTLVNPHKIVNETIDLLSSNSQRKKIQFSNEIHEDAQVFVDKHMLESIFRNLISNAIKFSFHDSKIECFSQVVGDQLEISVRDYGKGIDPAKVTSIFKDNVFPDDVECNEPSFGYGLKMVRDFVNLNKGEIECRNNEKDGGSIFLLRLPRSE